MRRGLRPMITGPSRRLDRPRDELPTAQGVGVVPAEEPVEGAHRRPRRDRQGSRIRTVDVFDQGVPARHDGQPIQIEEREARAADQIHLEPGAADDLREERGCEVTTMADVMIELRHRAAGHRDHDAAPGRQEGSDVAEQRRRLVDVLEDLRADGVGGPAPQLVGQLEGLHEIALKKSSPGHFSGSDLDASLAEIEAHDLDIGVARHDVAGEVPLPAPQIQETHGSRRRLQREELEDQLAPVGLRRVLGSRLSVRRPVSIPVVVGRTGVRILRRRGHETPKLVVELRPVNPDIASASWAGLEFLQPLCASAVRMRSAARVTLMTTALAPLALLPASAIIVPGLWGALGAAAIWGLGMVVCFAGWGSWLRRRLAPSVAVDWGLRAAWGFGLTLAAGGLLCRLGLARRPVLLGWTFAGIALAARELARSANWRRDRLLRPWRLIPRRWDTPLIVGLLCATGLVYVGAAGREIANPSDDWLAYLPFIKMI